MKELLKEAEKDCCHQYIFLTPLSMRYTASAHTVCTQVECVHSVCVFNNKYCWTVSNAMQCDVCVCMYVCTHWYTFVCTRMGLSHAVHHFNEVMLLSLVA